MDKVAQKLDDDLSMIVGDIAKDKNIEDFIEDVDLLEERLKKWHQFGLVTHMRKVREAFNDEIWGFLDKWGVRDRVERELSESIDGVSKKILLEISIMLHDLGKIVCHGDESVNRGHEMASRELLQEGYLGGKLEGYGLTVKQIEYISRCVETHFSLGQEMRDALKHKGLLNMEYLGSVDNKREIDRLCLRISEKYEDVKIEIGVFFLADCLGKTDVRGGLEVFDRGVAEGRAREEIERKGLPSELINAVMQLPLSVKLAEKYLKGVCEGD